MIVRECVFGGDVTVGWGQAVCLGLELVGEEKTEGSWDAVYPSSDSAISEMRFL